MEEKQERKEKKTFEEPELIKLDNLNEVTFTIIGSPAPTSEPHP